MQVDPCNLEGKLLKAGKSVTVGIKKSPVNNYLPISANTALSQDFVCLTDAPCRDTLGSWWDQTRTKCSARLKAYISMLVNWSMEIKRERIRFENMRRRKRRPWPLPTNQVEQVNYQLLEQDSRERRFFIQSQLPLRLFFIEHSVDKVRALLCLQTSQRQLG